MNIFIVCSMIILNFSFAGEKDNFYPPNLDGFWHYGDVFTDLDEDGVKESVVSFYKNSKNDKITKSVVDGKIWRWAEKSHKYPHDKNDISKNYVIIDSDCNGVFDTKYDLETEYDFPACLKK